MIDINVFILPRRICWDLNNWNRIIKFYSGSTLQIVGMILTTTFALFIHEYDIY